MRINKPIPTFRAIVTAQLDGCTILAGRAIKIPLPVGSKAFCPFNGVATSDWRENRIEIKETFSFCPMDWDEFPVIVEAVHNITNVVPCNPTRSLVSNQTILGTALEEVSLTTDLICNAYEIIYAYDYKLSELDNFILFGKQLCKALEYKRGKEKDLGNDSGVV